MLTVGAFLLLGALWTGWRAYQAYSHLASARAIVSDMTAEMRASGLDSLPALEAGAHEFAEETAAAHSAVADPIYRLATTLPWLGGNLGAVRDVAVTMDSIAQAADAGLPSLIPLADHGDWTSGGRFDLDVVRPAADAVIHLDAAVRTAIDAMRTIDRGSLAGPVADALGDYGGQLLKLADITTPGAQAAQVVMPILGSEGPRNYLVVFQNLAELRASGGLFGFYAELQVADGALTIGPSGSSDRDFGEMDPPIDGVYPGLNALYGGEIDRYPQDSNITPDFPTTASVFTAMYERYSGRSVDGMIAIDPVVVSVLMKGLPPIDLGHGLILSSESAVDVLLSELYDVFPGGDQLAQRDELMSAAVQASFAAVLDGVSALSPHDAIDDLTALIDERRVLVWSAHPAEQRQIEPTAVSGRQPKDTVGEPVVGLFLDSRTGAKLDYYARASAELSEVRCEPDGGATATLTVTMVNNAPLTGLPPYVLGAMNGEPVPEAYWNLVVTAPSAGSLGATTVAGESVPARRSHVFGRDTAVFSVTLVPGKPVTATVEVSLRPSAQGESGSDVRPRLVTSPMAFDFPTHAENFTVCNR